MSNYIILTRTLSYEPPTYAYALTSAHPEGVIHTHRNPSVLSERFHNHTVLTKVRYHTRKRRDNMYEKIEKREE